MNICFSLILKELLIKKNLKKVEFARKIGVKSQTTITNWLKGIGTPDWDQLLKIKKELKLNDIRELFGFDADNYITITKEEYEKAITNARLQEAREIAIGRETKKDKKLEASKYKNDEEGNRRDSVRLRQKVPDPDPS